MDGGSGKSDSGLLEALEWDSNLLTPPPRPPLVPTEARCRFRGGVGWGHPLAERSLSFGVVLELSGAKTKGLSCVFWNKTMRHDRSFY